VVEHATSNEQEPRRRRSTRIVQAVPLAVSGEDALGQPFKERTSTLILSCHGCRYQSKHYVPRNGWVELEVANPDAGRAPRRSRARVSWIQRPRTVRELFQVGVELETPGNIWGVAFPPDDWFPWPGDQPAAPSAAVAEGMAAVPLSSRLAAPSEPEPEEAEAHTQEAEHPLPTPPAVSEKVRSITRGEAPPEPAAPPAAADAVAHHVQKLLADARRQIQEDVKKIVSAVVTAESGQITAAMTHQMRGAATEAVKQALMTHGQAHAERLDVALREALARLEIVRYEAARAMKAESESDVKTVVEAASKAQESAEQSLTQALARLESAREETARALSMQSRAEGQRVMAQAATRMEDLLRQSLSRIEETSRASSDQLTASARKEMEHSVAGALEGLRADIAGTSDELRRLASSELESARKRLDEMRETIGAAAQQAAQDSLVALGAQVESARGQVAGLSREAAELDAAIQEKLGAGRGAWQSHLEAELTAAHARWDELVAQALAGATDSLRAQLQEVSAAATGPAVETLKQQVEAQRAAAQEALESVMAEAGHAVSSMREAAGENSTNAQRSMLEAQRIFGELETAMEARAAAARAAMDAIRSELESSGTEARTFVATQRGLLEAGAADARAAVAAQRGALEAGAAETRANLEAARSTVESRAAEMQAGLEGLRAALEGERRGIEALLADVRQAQSGIETARAELEALRGAAAADVRRELEAGAQARKEEIDARARQAWEEISTKQAPALEEAGRAATEKFRGEMEEMVRTRLQPELQRVEETVARLAGSQDHAEQVLTGFRERIHDAADGAVRETAERVQARVAEIEREFTAAGREATSRMLAEIEEKADDTTHKTFEQIYKTSEWYQKKTQASMQTAMDRALEQALGSLREKAGEMSSLFASELEHYSRSYAEHTRGLLEETAGKVKETVRGEIEVAADAARAHVTEEARRLAEQQIERARRATEFAAGEVIARVSSQAHDAEAAAAEASMRAVEQVEEHGARARDEMQELATRSAGGFAERLAQEVAASLGRAQQELDRALAPVVERWRDERAELQREWRAGLSGEGSKALEEHRDHLGNVANSLMATTVASLSEHSQTILDQLARDAEQRVRRICGDVFVNLGETLRQRMAGLSTDMASPGSSPAPPAGGDKTP